MYFEVRLQIHVLKRYAAKTFVPLHFSTSALDGGEW
jgi:hypothetical protein